MSTYTTNSQFGDKRLGKRVLLICSLLVSNISSSIGKISSSWSEQMGNYRFLNNEKVTSENLTEYVTSFCKEAVKGKHHILLVEDTVQFNYTNHIGRITQMNGLGPIGTRKEVGFYIHPSLVIDALDGSILGLSDIYLWNRRFDKVSKKERNYKKQDIELKESYRWIERARISGKLLSEVPMITVVQDREGDIYQSFSELPLSGLQLIIRSSISRKLKEGERLYEFIKTFSPAGSYIIDVNGSKKRQKRQAQVEIRYTKVQITRPEHLSGNKYPLVISLNFVQVKEKAESVPKGEKPIEWNLLTTHEVMSMQDAQQIAIWYSMRWLIEELFRVMKTEGFKLENSELEQGKRLHKLAIMVMFSATKVLQLKQARDGTIKQRTAMVFNEKEIECMEDILPTIEGKTEKQKNPHSKENLAWATWIIARVGGWKGYKSQRPPGVITLRDGLEKFKNIFYGWSVYQIKCV